MVNAGKLAVPWPSLAPIRMSGHVPTSSLPGVPLNVPVAASKWAHSGLFWMLKPAMSSAWATVGEKI